MTEFGYILIILFEILAAIFIIIGLNSLENKVKACFLKLDGDLNKLLQNIKDVRKNVENVNGAIEKIKKFNYKGLKNAVMLVLDIINFVFLVKSLKIQKGKPFGINNIKKLLPFGLISKILKEVKSFI